MGRKKKLKKKLKRLMRMLADEHVGPILFTEVPRYSLPNDLVYNTRSELRKRNLSIANVVTHARAWSSKVIGEYTVDSATLPLYRAYIDIDPNGDIRAITALLYNGSHPVQWVSVERDTYTNTWCVVNKFYHDTWDRDAERIGALGKLEALDFD